MAAGVGGALKHFWTLVNNWEHKQNAELRLNCENGHLLVNYSVDLGLWVPPTPRPPSDSASKGHQGPRRGVGPSRQRRRERRAADKAASTGTKDAATEEVAAKSGKEHTEDNSKSVVTKLDDKPNDASVEKSKKVSAEKDSNEKVVEEVTTVNTEFEKYNSVEVNPEKGVTEKTTH